MANTKLIEKMTKSDAEERSRPKSRAVSVFGAPVSWVALFAALIGFSSLVPLFLYPEGGGYFSLGMALSFFSGYLFGPAAGIVTAFVGGAIGMFISPGSYPLGIVDVTLSGWMLPLNSGLVANAHRPKVFVLFLAWYVSQIIMFDIFPYAYPGAAIGVAGFNAVNYFFSYIVFTIPIVIFIVLGRKIPMWMRSENRKTMIAGILLSNLIALGPWWMIWSWPYYWIFRLPYAFMLVANQYIWQIFLPVYFALFTLLYVPIIVGIRSTRLRKIPWSII